MIDQFLMSGISGGLIILLVYLIAVTPKVYRSIKSGNFKIWKPNSKQIFILVLLLAIVGTFYWYEVRPTQIKKECSWYSGQETTPNGTVRDFTRAASDKQYEECLRHNGID
jgi:hypothetical protein